MADVDRLIVSVDEAYAYAESVYGVAFGPDRRMATASLDRTGARMRGVPVRAGPHPVGALSASTSLNSTQPGPFGIKFFPNGPGGTLRLDHRVLTVADIDATEPDRGQLPASPESLGSARNAATAPTGAPLCLPKRLGGRLRLVSQTGVLFGLSC
jgi:hypothetical protein